MSTLTAPSHLQTSKGVAKLVTELLTILLLLAMSPSCIAQRELIRPESPKPAYEKLSGVDSLSPKGLEAAKRAWEGQRSPNLFDRPHGVLFDPPPPARLRPPRISLQGTWAILQLEAQFDPVRSGQRRLHELGYLHGDADVDGVMGPKTRLAARRFQQEEHLNVTGELDDRTLSALEIRSSLKSSNSVLIDHLHHQPSVDPILKELGQHPSDFFITETTSRESIRYQLQDPSRKVIEPSLDRQQLAAKLKELLNQSGGKAISIELPGFELNRTDALASSLAIRLRQVDPSLTLTAPTLMPPDQSLITTDGTWVRSSEIMIEKTGLDSFSSRVSFSGFLAKGRDFTLNVVCNSLNVILDFLDRLGILSRSPIWLASRSLQQSVNWAREDLKKSHPQLTDLDLQVMITDQAGNTGLVELRIETTFACS